MYLDETRSTFQKVILCIFAAMAILFAVLTIVNRANKGVLFHETLLEVSQQGSTTVYSGMLYGTPVTITSREENGTKYVNFSADGEYYAACRVEYPEGTIRTEFGSKVPRLRIIRNDEVLFSGGYDPDAANSAMKYYSEDGSWDPMISISAQSYGNPWYNFEFTMGNILNFAGNPKLAARGDWDIYIAAVFISIIGAVLAAFPETAFHLSHCLSVRDPEPTDFYFFMHKVGCIIFVIIVFVMYIIGLNETVFFLRLS